MAKGFGVRARGVAALLLLAASAGSARAEERYWITEIGTAEAYPDFWSTRLNQAGEIGANLPGGATLFTNGSTVTLGRSGPSALHDLNDWGQVLGSDEQGYFL